MIFSIPSWSHTGEGRDGPLLHRRSSWNLVFASLSSPVLCVTGHRTYRRYLPSQETRSRGNGRRYLYTRAPPAGSAQNTEAPLDQKTLSPRVTDGAGGTLRSSQLELDASLLAGSFSFLQSFSISERLPAGLRVQHLLSGETLPG